MNFTQSFRLAVKSLIASKMRALLTMLGIIIGVAAVIVITSLGNGMQNYMNRQFDQLGANLIQVQIWGLGGMSSRTVDPDDMYALVGKYPQYLSGVSPYVMTGATDAHFYQEICDSCVRFAPVIYGPEQMKGMHGINENIEYSCLPGAVDFYKNLIRAQEQ